MRHCIARHLPELVLGTAAAFSGTLLGDRISVLVDLTQSSPRVQEARGFANRLLSDVELELLCTWASKLGHEGPGACRSSEQLPAP